MNQATGSGAAVDLSILRDAMRAKGLSNDEALVESFDVVQRASAIAASAALSQLAVRFAAGGDDLAQLVRTDQDLLAEQKGLDKSLVEAVSKDPRERNTNREGAIK